MTSGMEIFVKAISTTVANASANFEQVKQDIDAATPLGFNSYTITNVTSQLDSSDNIILIVAYGYQSNT